MGEFVAFVQSVGSQAIGGAVFLAAWWFERRENVRLQTQIIQLAQAQTHAIAQTQATLDALQRLVTDRQNRKG